MLVRALQLAIIVFWLGTVIWLVRDIRRESNHQLSEANVDFVLDTLYNWSDSTRLNLFENGDPKAIGRVDVSASKDLTDPENAPRFISLSGLISGFERKEKSKSVRGRATFSLNRDREIISADLSVEEVGAKGLSFALRMDDSVPAAAEKGAALTIAAMNGDTPILQFDGHMNELAQGLSGGGGAMFPAMAFLPAIPLDLEEAKEGALGGATDFFENLTAWQGTKDFDGHSISIFMLKKTFGPNQSVRLYLTEAGEPLKLETDIGFEAISDILIATP